MVIIYARVFKVKHRTSMFLPMAVWQDCFQQICCAEILLFRHCTKSSPGIPSPNPQKKLWFVPNANQPRNIEGRINPSPPAVCKRFCFIQIQNPRLTFSYSCTLKSVNRLDQESWRGSRLETKAKQQIYFRARLIH